MIKILHIVHGLTRGGGLCNLIMNYYRQIDREQIQFDFIYFKEVDNDFKDEITALGGRYFKMTEPSLNLRFLQEREAFFKAHQGEYAAVHCHVLFAAAAYASTAKKYGVCNVISHAHTSSYGVGLVRKLRNCWLVKAAGRHATHYMACSEDAAILMFGKKAVESGRVTLINNAIDLTPYAFDVAVRNEVRKELKIPENTFVVGHVGGFSPPKNHLFLIDVFREICRRSPDAVLLLAGGAAITAGSTVEAIREKVNAYGLQDNVRFLGIRSDVPRLMMAMDAFVFPSFFEGLGIALVEAQATGLPSYASTGVPAFAKCTDLVSFLSLEKGAKAWAQTIDEARPSANARKVDMSALALYDIAVQKEKLEQVYLSLK